MRVHMQRRKVLHVENPISSHANINLHWREEMSEIDLAMWNSLCDKI